jgi:hypothetical protein
MASVHSKSKATCSPARYRRIPRSSSVVTLPTELFRIPKGPDGLDAAPAKQQASLEPHLPPSPSPKTNVPNQKIIQQSPGHSYNCFTLNHRPVNHPPRSFSAVTSDYGASAGDNPRLPVRHTHTATLHPSSCFQQDSGLELCSLGWPRSVEGASGSNAHTNGGRREICHCYPWCSVEWTVWNFTYLTWSDTTRSPLLLPTPCILCVSYGSRIKPWLFP